MTGSGFRFGPPGFTATICSAEGKRHFSHISIHTELKPSPASPFLPLPAPVMINSAFSNSEGCLPVTRPALPLSSAQLTWIHLLPHAEAPREMTRAIFYFLSRVFCTQSFMPGRGWRQASVTVLCFTRYSIHRGEESHHTSRKKPM